MYVVVKLNIWYKSPITIQTTKIAVRMEEKDNKKNDITLYTILRSKVVVQGGFHETDF